MTGAESSRAPSQLAPLAALVLGEVLAHAGVPAGVYSVVQGEGETGALLASHQVTNTKSLQNAG